MGDKIPWQSNKNDNNFDINPSAIHIGAIVEVQISFKGIQLKGNRSKMAIILRAITVLGKGAYYVSVCID